MKEILTMFVLMIFTMTYSMYTKRKKDKKMWDGLTRGFGAALCLMLIAEMTIKVVIPVGEIAYDYFNKNNEQIAYDTIPSNVSYNYNDMAWVNNCTGYTCTINKR